MTPMRPPIACPRCRVPHKGKCPQRARKRTNPFYKTKRWERLSESKRKTDVCCERCLAQDITTMGALVHHVIPIEDDMSQAYEWDNLETLCHPCHNREHHAGS